MVINKYKSMPCERCEEVGIASHEHSHQDVMFSIENIVNNIEIAMYSVRCVLDLSGRSFHKVHECLITMLCT